MGGITLNTIEETIKMAPFLKGKVWRKQIEFIQQRVAKDEEKVIAVCFKKDGLQQLYVTPKRVYFNEIAGMFSNNEKTIPVATISSVECSSKGLFADVIINTSGARIVVEDVSVAIAQEVARTIEDLKLNSNGPSTSQTSSKDIFDLADEIRELKDLLDDGILTQEEFDAKKKQLLGI